MTLSFPVSPSVGQGYLQFQWDGAKWVPNPGVAPGLVTSVDGASGAVSLKGRRTELARVVIASATQWATIANVFSTTYDQFEISAYGMMPAALAQPVMQVGSGATPTWATGSDYIYAYQNTWQRAVQNTFGAAGGGAVATWLGPQQTLGNVAPDTFPGQIEIKCWQPAAVNGRKGFWWHGSFQGNSGTAPNDLVSFTGAATVWSLNGAAIGALSSIRFGYGATNAGDTNIAQGTYVVYGVNK
jgi:hypothetical protein